MNIALEHPPVRPWYRHFWVWFIVALPAAVVVAGLTTVGIAVIHQDSVVRDDWYKDGKAINQSLARDAAAARLGLRATVRLDALTGELGLDLQADAAGFTPPATLQLQFSHPTQARADQTVALTWRDGRYHGQLREALAGRFHVELGNSEWRLQGERGFPQTEFFLSHD